MTRHAEECYFVCEIQTGFQLTFVFDNNGGTRIGINGYRMNTDDD